MALISENIIPVRFPISRRKYYPLAENVGSDRGNPAFLNTHPNVQRQEEGKGRVNITGGSSKTVSRSVSLGIITTLASTYNRSIPQYSSGRWLKKIKRLRGKIWPRYENHVISVFVHKKGGCSLSIPGGKVIVIPVDVIETIAEEAVNPDTCPTSEFLHKYYRSCIKSPATQRYIPAPRGCPDLFWLDMKGGGDGNEHYLSALPQQLYLAVQRAVELDEHNLILVSRSVYPRRDFLFPRRIGRNAG